MRVNHLASLLLVVSAVQASAQTLPYCRVVIPDAQGMTGYGSGVVVDINSAGDALVLTAAHVAEGVGRASCRFTDGQQVDGRIVAKCKKGYDLAAISVKAPKGVIPIRLAEYRTGEQLYVCGFGGQGRLRYAAGESGRSGGRTTWVSSVVREGDSGGPVCAVRDGRLHLVGILWGCDFQASTATTTGEPVYDFLFRLCQVCQDCPPGQVCPPNGWQPSPQFQIPGREVPRPSELWSADQINQRIELPPSEPPPSARQPSGADRTTTPSSADPRLSLLASAVPEMAEQIDARLAAIESKLSETQHTHLDREEVKQLLAEVLRRESVTITAAPDDDRWDRLSIAMDQVQSIINERSER